MRSTAWTNGGPLFACSAGERGGAWHSPGGALSTVFVDAPALEFAEDAVQSVTRELLERSELLAEWTVERCEVRLHPQLAQESLDAAGGPETPPADAATRKAHHRNGDSRRRSGRV
ncbi:hypothetical protein AABB02_37650 [Streptomyces rimosus]|uniref:hypothetical protein n=1 Tax=Streptomyces rimosus TaxID=1927 RepID=UPI0031E488ED